MAGITDYRAKLNELLLMTARQNASDLHLAVGRRPTLRIDGVLIQLQQEPMLTPELAEGLVLELLTPGQREILFRDRQVDFSYSLEDKARFRANAYFQRGFLAVALRLINAKIKTIEELNLPPLLHEFAKLSQGFVLIVGPAGHGKSTTLASLVDEINHTRTDHIISTAMTAAETGHLVFATLHTSSAAQTIDRIIDSFPAEQQGQITSQLAATLIAILSIRLMPRLAGGRIPAMEIMIVNPAIRKLIFKRKGYPIDLVIETSLQ